MLRWGAAGRHEYEGELLVDFVADGTSKLTVCVHTTHDVNVEVELEQTLAEIKSTLEQEAAGPPGEPKA